jgi:hypothetical protein
MAVREQNGNAPALSTMAANGRARAKWECPSAQHDSSEWPCASKMGTSEIDSKVILMGHEIVKWL